MKYLSRIAVLAVAALGFAACSDTSDIIDAGTSLADDMTVNITMELPRQTYQTRSKVSGTEERVSVMQMVCFDANGLYLGIRNADVEPDAGPTPDTGKIKGTVPQGTSRIHFIANRSLTVPLSFNVGTAEETVMMSEELSTIWNDTDQAHRKVCYWGYHKEASADAMNAWLNPTSTPNKVYMIRDRAKVILDYNFEASTDEPTDKVKKIEWLIHNGRERGYLAPKSSEWGHYYETSSVEGHTSENISVATMNEYTACQRYSLWRSETDNDDDKFDVAYENGKDTHIAQFLFDDANDDIDDVRVIIRVTYTPAVGGTEDRVFYHVLRLNDDDKV